MIAYRLFMFYYKLGKSYYEIAMIIFGMCTKPINKQLEVCKHLKIIDTGPLYKSKSRIAQFIQYNLIQPENNLEN